MLNAYNIEDLHSIARERLSSPVYGYFAGGAGDELTLRDNIEAFQRIKIAYRTMIDISAASMKTSLLGIDLSMPIILAPTALHRMAHEEGEIATAKAAAEAGTLMTLSTISSVPLEEVAAAAPHGKRWFQLYLFNTPEQTETLIARAEAAGYGAIVLTADAPILGRRERDLRLGFSLPDGVQAVHFDLVPRSTFSPEEPPTIGAFIHQPDLSWAHLAWIRERTQLPIILKGIVRGDDAEKARDAGIAAVWVSNHGGRQLDTSIATADALPEVVARVGGQLPIIMDGGIRRGTDVLKALAMGADAVAVGRAQLWGLAAGGRDGVALALRMLRDEFAQAMALAGAVTLGDLTPDLLRRP
ncbi:MAG: alpha-hydroxy acid oxidase [Actinomycetota bacterium]